MNKSTAIGTLMAVALLTITACTVWATDATPTHATVSVESVRKAIVGTWNPISDTPTIHASYLLSFDDQGRITETGLVLSDGRVSSFGEYRQGKVRYRLEQRKDGAGVNVIEITSEEQHHAYIVEAVGDGVLTVRTIDYETKQPKDPIVWKRVSKDPIKVEEKKANDKK